MAALGALLILLLSAEAGAQGSAPVTLSTPGGEVTVVADRMEQIGPDNLLIATGNVEITRGSARLTADRVEMNRRTGDSVATGHVVFYDGEDRLTSDRIDYNFNTGTGVVHGGEARAAPYYRLGGQRFERLGESVYRVNQGVFTTCEADPPSWSFRMGSATADLDSFIYGRDASFWIKDVPVIPWFPFFAAAIRRERQSGFLFPRIGTSSNKGVFAEIPVYWAISDSQDVTVALDEFEKRGVGGTVDYRYIYSADTRGEMKGFFLDETARHGAERGWGAIRHQWLIAPDLTLKADVNRVTDDAVIRQYGDTLHQISQQRVESNVFVTRRWPTWNLVGNVFSYQDLTTRRPIELNRLPDITLTGPRQPLPGRSGVLYELNAEAVRFVRDVGSDGTRLDFHPRLSRPLSPEGMFTVTPFAGGRLTGYDRRVTGTHVGTDGQVTEVTNDTARLRRLYEVGTDVATTLSRVYRSAGVGNFDTFLHTIEPRATYTLTDGQGKNSLPFWTDTDQIRAGNRIDYSITNRLRGRTVAPEGTEALRLEVVRFVLGHSVDFKNNQQVLGNATADLIVQPTPNLKFRGDVSHDVQGRGLQTADGDVSLELQRLTAAIGSRYIESTKTNFFQGSLKAEATRNVIARVSTNWDLHSGNYVENRFGVDVRFQCWALSLDYIERSPLANTRRDNELRFAITLLGVGGPISNAVGLGSLGPVGSSTR